MADFKRSSCISPRITEITNRLLSDTQRERQRRAFSAYAGRIVLRSCLGPLSKPTAFDLDVPHLLRCFPRYFHRRTPSIAGTFVEREMLQLSSTFFAAVAGEIFDSVLRRTIDMWFPDNAAFCFCVFVGKNLRCVNLTSYVLRTEKAKQKLMNICLIF